MTEYVWQADRFYLGDRVQQPVHTRNDLLVIITQALQVLQADLKAQGCGPCKYRDALEIVSSWFEHDAHTQNHFDALVPEEEFDDFVRRAWECTLN